MTEFHHMSDEELLAERDRINTQLRRFFFEHSGKYDAGAMQLRLIEREILRRDIEGPPWMAAD